MHTNGSIDYGKRSKLSSGIYDAIANVLPAQDSQGGAGGSTSGTCGADGRQFCPAPWPLAEFGPIPRAPPSSTELGPPPVVGVDGTKNLTVCGNKCSGQSDCTASNDDYGCDCAFPNAEDAQALGLDPVAPPSICLSLDKVTFGLSTSVSALSLVSLVGRNEVALAPRYVDEQGVPYQCRCNTTYVGNECCGSRDGMVWLE